MDIIYKNLHIQFKIGPVQFHVLKMSYEHFFKPVPYHSHGIDSYEIHYISNGFGYVGLDGEKYTVSPGTLYVTGPQVRHEQISDIRQPMTEYGLYLKIQCEDMSSSHYILELIRHPSWIGKDTQNILSVFELLFKEMSSKEVGYQTVLAALFQKFIINLIRNFATGSVEDNADFLIEDMRLVIIEENFLYNSNSITLPRLSALLGLSTRQTERFLKNTYGKTFEQKKLDARMSQSALLLANTKKSISEIALELGYSSLEHFSSTFRRYYGTPPSTYRKSPHKYLESL